MSLKIVKKVSGKKSSFMKKPAKVEEKQCKNCSFFVGPTDVFDEQGNRIDFGICNGPDSDLYRKTVLMVHKGCSVFKK